MSEEKIEEINNEEEKECLTFNKELIKDMIRKTSFCASIDEGKKIIELAKKIQ